MATAPDDSPPAPRRRLHTIVAAVLFFLLVGVAVGEAIYTFTAVKRIAEQATVENASSLVDRLAQGIEPALGTTIDSEALRRASSEMRDYIPGADPYLVKPSGEIVANFSDSELVLSRIDMTPIERFLTLPRPRNVLIRAQDPTDPDERTLFAATRLAASPEPLFLYVVLREAYFLRLLRYQFDENVIQLVVVVVLSELLIAAGAGMLISRFLTARIRALSDALVAFRRGEYSRRVEVRGSDELAELAAVANGMAEKIEVSVRELADRDRLRRELIANVSHDLRSPASILKGYSSLLLEPGRAIPEDERRSIYEAIAHGSSALSNLLSQLWELSKLETREQAVERIPFAMSEIVSEIAGALSEKARAEGVRLIEGEYVKLPLVSGDPNLIARAIQNLIENAITYTPEGGRVEISVSRGERGARVEIRDTGVGIAEEDLPKIFDRSYRVKKWEKMRSESGGLGLAIVQRIVESHGSTVEVASKENEGSTFSFELAWAAE